MSGDPSGMTPLAKGPGLPAAGAPPTMLRSVNLLIVTPMAGDVWTGNRNTAHTWSERLQSLGHRVTVHQQYRGGDADMLIALHARKSHESIVAFRKAHPGRPIIVALTGSDLYPVLDDVSRKSLAIADRIVVLQPRARDRVPATHRDKVSVIVQSVEAQSDVPAPAESPGEKDTFDICVVGHLREVKDPFRAAAAARLLPAESTIRICHAGAILEAPCRERVEREQAENPRYTWLGELEHRAARQLIARCRLQILSSVFEGGGCVIGESLVAGTPLLAARNDASCSLLGDDYAGLFDAGDTGALCDLMSRAETDTLFLDRLRDQCAAKRSQFDIEPELDAWRELIAWCQDRRRVER